MIVENAPAKINLALHVRRRRPDGYHEIETLFAFAADGDRITVAPADAPRFAINGPFAEALRGDSEEAWADNLVTRAADGFAETFGDTGALAITLDKQLPIASGIGGGSADAAATLRALARRHDVSRDDPRLFALATRLGADVPACLAGQTLFGRGIGEALEPIAGLPGTPLLLVNPVVAVSTAAIFRAWDGVDRGPIADGGLLERARAGRNDLQPPAIALAPVIAEVDAMLRAAPGVLFARMSGSGATCFALFDDMASRDAAGSAAAAQGWWTLATTLA